MSGKGHLEARQIARTAKDPAVKELAKAVMALAERVNKLEAAIKPPKSKAKTDD